MLQMGQLILEKINRKLSDSGEANGYISINREGEQTACIYLGKT